MSYETVNYVIRNCNFYASVFRVFFGHREKLTLTLDNYIESIANLLMRGPGEFDSRKKAKTSRDTATLRTFLITCQIRSTELLLRADTLT